ncbi:TolC family protein [Pyrinomonas sp.]|uniref:TolC family protein n=1 Tax=Pyrinomonas sp. TaxID=2080306 RepID=UPI0033214BA4
MRPDASALTAEQLVEMALARRADLLAARARAEAARARALQAGLRPNPTLETEYGTPRFLGGEAELDFSVGVSQLFELGDKRRLRKEAARLEAERVEAELHALEQRIASEVRAAFARAVAAGQLLETLNQLVALGEDLERATAARLKEGDVAAVDLDAVRVELERVRAERARAQADFEAELIALRSSVGLDLDAPLRVAPLEERPPRLDFSLAELTEIALRERADLRAARLAESASAARLRLAEAQRTPDVAAVARFSRSKQIVDLPERLGGVALDRDNELTFGLQVALPVFNRNQGEIAAAASERVQATKEREFLEAAIKRDVALGYRRYLAAAESLELFADRIVPQSEAILRRVRAAYGLGEFSIFDVLQEQRRLIESQTRYREAVRDYYAALADLERAVGAPLLRRPRADRSAPTTSTDAEKLRRALLQERIQR